MAALLLAACTSTTNPSLRRQAGTGDIAFRLLWEGADDLDLHVVDPRQRHLFWSQRRSDSGGQLDIDCNGSPIETCERPIENVFWPEDEAPDGRYLAWVALFRLEPPPGPVRYELQVRQGRRVTARRSGQLVDRCELAGPWAVDFRRGQPVELSPALLEEVTAAVGETDPYGCLAADGPPGV